MAVPSGLRSDALRDPAAFIRTNTAFLRPPLVPEIALHLASDAVPLWRVADR